MKAVAAVWIARNRYAALDSAGNIHIKSSSHEVSMEQIYSCSCGGNRTISQ